MNVFRGSLVAIVTPMDAQAQLDLVSFRRLIDAHVAAGTAGIVVAGTTGEGVSLRKYELEQLIEVAADQIAGRVPLIAGVGLPVTRRTVKLAKLATNAGADALLVVTPSYLKTTQQGLLAHYYAVAEAASRPLVLYNVPSRTAVDLAPETTATLAEHENIVGIKDAVADNNRIARLRELCGADFAILSGDDETFLASLQQGADGVVSVSANLVPSAMAQIAAQFSEATGLAQALDDRLQPLHRWTMSEPNPIPVKAALVDLGLINGGLRLPLVVAQPETSRRWRDLRQSLTDLLINLP